MGRPVVHRSDEEEEQQQQRDEDASHSLNALATGLSPLFPFNYYYYYFPLRRLQMIEEARGRWSIERRGLRVAQFTTELEDVVFCFFFFFSFHKSIALSN